MNKIKTDMLLVRLSVYCDNCNDNIWESENSYDDESGLEEAKQMALKHTTKKGHVTMVCFDGSITYDPCFKNARPFMAKPQLPDA